MPACINNESIEVDKLANLKFDEFLNKETKMKKTTSICLLRK
jgi:hypothetical protein